MEPLKGRTVLITGADKGLGRKMATSFAANGMNIGLIGYSVHNLEEIADDVKFYGVQTSVVPADVSDINQAYEAVNRVKKELGFLDTLINNTGTITSGNSPAVKSISPGKNTSLDAKGICYITRAVLPEMVRNRKGDIVNIALAEGLKTNLSESTYTASKDELIHMSESLMQEVRKYNIRVTSLTPDMSSVNHAGELNWMNENRDYTREMWFEDITEEVLSQLKINRSPAVAGTDLISVV